MMPRLAAAAPDGNAHRSHVEARGHPGMPERRVLVLAEKPAHPADAFPPDDMVRVDPGLDVAAVRDVPAHDWHATTNSLRDTFTAAAKADANEGGASNRAFELVVCEEPAVLESSALATYDVLIINALNPEEHNNSTDPTTMAVLVRSLASDGITVL